MAAGARDALADMARTDIGYVAKPAAAALREASLNRLIRLTRVVRHAGVLWLLTVDDPVGISMSRDG